MKLEILDTYRSYLDRQPISIHTRRGYLQKVTAYLAWLDATPDGDKGLIDVTERDFAVREYKAHLMMTGSSPNSINAILGAIANFDLSRGVLPCRVKRLELPRQAPRALDPAEEKRLLKVIAKSDLRDRTLALLFMHTGFRISEVASLNLGDVSLTSRKGEITVRCGKGQKTRVVPINSELREVLHLYLCGQVGRPDTAPLFISQKKCRLSLASIDRTIRALGKDAGIELSAHTLRHGFVTSLVRSGCDLILVAELAGHSRLETTRRYSMPTENDKQNAVEKLSHAS